MSSDRRGAVKHLRKLVFTPKSKIESFRAAIEEAFYEPFLPQGVTCTEEVINGIPCDILEPQVFASDRVLLYVHGGSFIGGSRKAWRGFCASLAHASSTKVVLPEIRLAPQSPFPAALEDLKAVFKGLYAQKPQIFLAGDGSGASIALALTLSLKGSARAKLKKLVFLSPWLDLSDSAPVYRAKKAKDEIITPDSMRRTANMYTYTSNMTNPLVSVRYAQPPMLEGFPEVFIQMGGREILMAEVEDFRKLLEENGCKCTVDVWPDMMHLFQMAHEFLDESHHAIDALGKVIKAGNARDEREEDGESPATEVGA